MTNHPNRGRSPGPDANPTPAQVIAAREAAKLTRRQAAAVIRGSVRAWEKYELGERRMHPGLFELFILKTQGPSSAP